MAFPSTYTAETVNQLAAALNAQRATSGAAWEGGLGADKSALYMADELAKSGITDLSQVGQGNGNIINKVTGQPLYSGYGERTGGNIWSGSYEGGGNTGFGVNFDDKGNPIFFTQGASSSTLNDDLLKAAALAAAAYGGYTMMGGESLFGGAGLTTSELAAADMALGGAGGTAGAEALASAAAAGGTTLTASQIANLAKAGINVAGLMGATNAISNMGNATTTPMGTALPTQAAPEYTADYYAKLQSAYNQALPGMPRDVVSNLADWYGGSTGGMMSGSTTAPTTQAPISNGITRTPANLVAPMTSLMNAYRSGNVGDTKQALIGALNSGMSTEQLMKTFNLGMQDIDYLRGQGYYLPAMTNEIKDVVSQELQNPATAYQNIVAKMDATGTNPAAVAAALGLSTEEVQNAYNQLNPTGLFASNNPNFGAVDAGFIYNVAENPADYQTAIQEVQKYRAADEAGQQSVVEKALAAELAARPGASLSALQQMGTAYGVSPADVAAAYAKLGYV